MNRNCFYFHFYFQFEPLGLAWRIGVGERHLSTHRLHARLSRNLIYRMAHERP